MISPQQVHAHRLSGPWRKLERLAKAIVEDASERAGTALEPLLGGGTRLMLAIEHRISDDIDLFIRDPQWLGYITPRLNDRFEHVISAYDEGATSLKLRCAEGEIDFIVGMSLLGQKQERADDSLFALEPVAEVLAKKLFYRGWALTPRDLFDWWSVSQIGGELNVDRGELAQLLSTRLDVLSGALNAMKSSRSGHAAWEAIRAPDLPPLPQALQWAGREVEALRELARDHGISKDRGVNR